MRYALAYLVCFQITVNHVHIAHCQQLIDCGINLYIQKEKWFGFSKMEILTPDELVERINRE